ncbi:MAG TPA: cytochrome P450 [Microthrixaceae bacterium]|nr:cytochrome P450 [Microthrixaceae bacterium]
MTSLVVASLDDIDLCDLDRFANGFPHETFEVLRHRAPVWFHPPTSNVPGGEGFWVLSKYRDVMAAASDGVTFSSRSGGTRQGGGTLIEDLPEGFTGTLLNMTDDPYHQRFRSLLTPALSPKALGKLEAELRERAHRIVVNAMELDEVDLLTDIAAELPMQAAAGLLGVPQSDRKQLMDWADATLDYEDRDLGGTSERAVSASAEMFAYGAALIETRRREPGEDLLSAAIHGTVDDGESVRSLRDDELQLLFSLLVAAGTETTRNTIAVGVAALAERHQQWISLDQKRSLLPNAVEEMLRWASSTPYNRRTATQDVLVGEEKISAGEKVTLWWASANRDEDEFLAPFLFDIRRNPNRHLAFGHGSHFCLGARLARLEISVLLEELLDAVESVEVTGPTVWTRSNKHTGVRHLPVHLTPK